MHNAAILARTGVIARASRFFPILPSLWFRLQGEVGGGAIELSSCLMVALPAVCDILLYSSVLWLLLCFICVHQQL